MNRHKLLQQMVGMVLVLLLLAGCGAPAATPTPVPSTATPTPRPPGIVTGKVMYEELTNGGSTEPMPDVMIALCRVPAEGLPEGPTVTRSNRGETEHICTLQGVPTALTDAGGAFTLDGALPGTYLVMFHLFPAEVEAQGVEWNGVALTEAAFDEGAKVVSPSGKSDFWEDGGPAIALGSWSAAQGLTVSTGNVCSDKFGFCFSIRDERPHPVIEVEPNETVEIELTAHFRPSQGVIDLQD